MKLALPPERPLPHPDRMIDRILEADGPSTTRSARPGRARVLLIGSIAAGLAVAATAIGVGVLRPGGGQLVGSPPSTSRGVPSPGGSVSTGPGPGQTASPTPFGRPSESQLPMPPVPLGTSLAYGDLAVSVTDVDRTWADGLRVLAEVCVVVRPGGGGRVSVGWPSWQLNGGGVPATGQPGSAAGPMFPEHTTLQVHECAEGWILFAGVGSGAGADEVRFLMPGGGALSWSVAGPAAAVGTTVSLPHVKVTVTGSGGAGGVYVLYVKTCVTSLPAGARSVSLGWSDWSLATSAGPIDSSAPLVNVPPLPATYPNSGRYRVGDCAAGALPLGSGADTAVYAISFADEAGDRAVWRPGA